MEKGFWQVAPLSHQTSLSTLKARSVLNFGSNLKLAPWNDTKTLREKLFYAGVGSNRGVLG